ncbi:hypothetical protein P4234_30805 [Pseudomonas aeruginosa]|nr:hypothetical protein [Pseudomonas aeruginosa]
MWNGAHLSGGNAAYVEELYELYLHDLTLCQKSGARISRSFPPMAIPPPTSRTPQCAIISSCWPRTSAVPSRFPPVA